MIGPRRLFSSAFVSACGEGECDGHSTASELWMNKVVSVMPPAVEQDLKTWLFVGSESRNGG